MASKPTVTLTLAGDSDRLTQAFAEVDQAAEKTAREAKEAAEQMDRSMRDAADGVDRSSRDIGQSLDRFGEAADTADTRAMGFRDGLTGLQDTMAATGEIARGNLFEGLLLVGSGLADIGSTGANFVVPTLKTLIERFGLLRVVAVGLGGALAIAAGAIWYFAQRTDDAGDAAQRLGDDIKNSALAGRLGDDLRRSLDKISDSQLKVAASSKSMAFLWEEADRQLADAIKSGASYEEVMRFLSEAIGHTNAQNLILNGLLPQTVEAANDSRFAAQYLAESVEVTAEKYREASREITKFTDLVMGQTNPIFGFVNAQRRLHEAQEAENEAIKEFGANSQEAQNAAWARREAELALVEATARVAVVNRDELIPTLQRLAQDGHISEDTLRAIADAADIAEYQLSQLDGTRVTITFDQVWRAQFGKGVVLPSGERVHIGGAAFSVLHDGGVVPGPAGQEVLAILQAGERVIPLEDASRGGQTIVVNTGGNRLMDFLIEELGRAIAARGGNVQLVLGR